MPASLGLWSDWIKMRAKALYCWILITIIKSQLKEESGYSFPTIAFAVFSSVSSNLQWVTNCFCNDCGVFASPWYFLHKFLEIFKKKYQYVYFKEEFGVITSGMAIPLLWRECYSKNKSNKSRVMKVALDRTQLSVLCILRGAEGDGDGACWGFDLRSGDAGWGRELALNVMLSTAYLGLLSPDCLALWVTNWKPPGCDTRGAGRERSMAN